MLGYNLVGVLGDPCCEYSERGDDDQSRIDLGPSTLCGHRVDESTDSSERRRIKFSSDDTHPSHSECDLQSTQHEWDGTGEYDLHENLGLVGTKRLRSIEQSIVDLGNPKHHICENREEHTDEHHQWWSEFITHRDYEDRGPCNRSDRPYDLYPRCEERPERLYVS